MRYWPNRVPAAYSNRKGNELQVISRTIVSLVLLLLGATSWASARHTSAASETRPLNLLDLGAPTFTNFSARDGLPDAVTVAVATDRDGFVWAASPAGVFPYDGHRWVGSDDPTMAHPVDSVRVDRGGTLWAAFRSDGLARYDGRRWHVENISTGLPSQQVRRFAETLDAGGGSTLWAVTWDKGLMVRRNGHWQGDPDNNGLPHGPILSMAQTLRLDGHRRQWVGTGSQGLWYRDDGTKGWRQWHAEGLDSSQVEYLLATEYQGREELWVSVFGDGLWRLSGDGLKRWSKEGGELPTNELYDMAVRPLPSGDRAIWISSRSGLLRVHDDHVQIFDRRYGLPSNVIRGLNVWHSPGGEDVIWLATESGVSRTVLGGNAWTTASLMGAGSIGVFGVLLEPDDQGGERLWVGASDDGLALYTHDSWHRFTAADGSLPAPSVSMVVATQARDGTRTRWVGLRGGELLRVRMRDADTPVFEPVLTPWPKDAGEAPLDTLVRTIDGAEEQWVATRQSGIYRLRNGQWTAFRAAGVVDQWRVIKLQQQIDRKGRQWLWASTDQGLARFDGQKWDLFARSAGLPDADLMSLSLLNDADGSPILWIGTSSTGITRVDVSDPSHPRPLQDTLPPAPDASAYGALRDSTGRIYICTNNGVQQLVPASRGYNARVFTRKDGMVHDECNTNAQFIDAHDRYWAGTLGGLTVYDPRGASQDTQPKPLRITQVSIDGKQIDSMPEQTTSGDHGMASVPALQVGAGVKNIDVEFALLSWSREGESRFRTQLIGYEDKPGEWTAQPSRTFNSLPPGDYRLRVEARDHAGNISRTIDLPIMVAAHWWQRWWAIALAALVVLLLGYVMALLRMRGLQARRRSLERRVAERTAELDAANARLLELSYHDALTGLANRRSLLERLDQPPPTDGTRTALILVDVDHFKAYNDRFGHPAGDEALRGVASRMLLCAPAEALVARYGGEEFACLLPATDIAIAVTLAEGFREAVAACDIDVPGTAQTMRVTISAGVASAVLANREDAHRMLRDADMALYQAKRDGRNRVCVRDEFTAQPDMSEGPGTDFDI